METPFGHSVLPSQRLPPAPSSPVSPLAICLEATSYSSLSLRMHHGHYELKTEYRYILLLNDVKLTLCRACQHQDQQDCCNSACSTPRSKTLRCIGIRRWSTLKLCILDKERCADPNIPTVLSRHSNWSRGIQKAAGRQIIDFERQRLNLPHADWPL